MSAKSCIVRTRHAAADPVASRYTRQGGGREGTATAGYIMAVEFQVLKSSEFVRIGAHGELDWEASIRTLAKIADEFQRKGMTLAMLDVRDGVATLSDEQVIALAGELVRIGMGKQHRLAVLHKPRPRPLADLFAAAAMLRGCDVMAFDDYESAAEWLSSSREADPDFDRDVYTGPTSGTRGKDRRSPGDQQ